MWRSRLCRRPERFVNYSLIFFSTVTNIVLFPPFYIVPVYPYGRSLGPFVQKNIAVRGMWKIFFLHLAKIFRWSKSQKLRVLTFPPIILTYEGKSPNAKLEFKFFCFFYLSQIQIVYVGPVLIFTLLINKAASLLRSKE